MKQLLTTSIIMLIAVSLWAQPENKKPLDYNCFDIWKNIRSYQLSHNGEWISYEKNPQEGDGLLFIKNPDKGHSVSFARGKHAKFSPQNDFIAFRVVPQFDTIRAKKRNKVKEKNLPKDSLFVYRLDDEKLFQFARVKSFKVAPENSNWLAVHFEKEKQKKDTTKNKDDKEKDKILPDVSQFMILNPAGDIQLMFDEVSEYAISRNGEMIAFVRLKKDSIPVSTVFYFDTKKQKLDSLKSRQGLIKKITIANYEKKMAFIHSTDTIKEKSYALYYFSEKTGKEKMLLDTLSAAIPEKWTVSEHGKLYFSRNDSKLYFGIAPKPVHEPKDTLLDEEKVNVDIWHWKDPLLQPQQLVRKEKELKRTFLTVYHTKSEKIVQLADSIVRNIKTSPHGNENIALGIDYQPYQKMLSWEYPAYSDVYFINSITGQRKLILKKIQSRVHLSPGGKYIVWYENSDSTWNTYDVEAGKRIKLTAGLNVNFYNEEDDYPADPYPYGIAGWTKNDEYVLIYDRFDIWKFQPSGKDAPQKITNGRDKNIRYRNIRTDRDKKWITENNELLLSGFNEKDKSEGFYSLNIKKENAPQVLIHGNFNFRFRGKAKNTEKVLFSRENLQVYPDLLYADMSFKNPEKISHANPQQKEYNWANVELVKWITTDGLEEEGLLYKPENFDSDKKYPLMVYFYRLYSNRLHRHYYPYPSRSIINPLFYASNGYMVFIPNVRYKTGYPGESSFNYVVSGTLDMINRGNVDKNRIGIQGQSWGGYQVAYIVTRTDLFKAASPGAPVSNMTSAYGGIRWGSGMSRMFQYEETQSRIGGTLWEKPLHYIENSPVFYAPKINTPLLIRHDDEDGAVPWYQGIELFVALRRLNKPAWLINYNNAPHNLTKKRANQIDWTIRMKQFFDHYLNNQPTPVWLEKGIPATQKGKTMGLELMENK